MRGRVHARRTLKGLVADLRLKTMFSMSYEAMNIFSTYVIGYCVCQINFNYGCRSEKE